MCIDQALRSVSLTPCTTLTIKTSREKVLTGVMVCPAGKYMISSPLFFLICSGEASTAPTVALSPQFRLIRATVLAQGQAGNRIILVRPTKTTSVQDLLSSDHNTFDLS